MMNDIVNDILVHYGVGGQEKILINTLEIS